MKAEGVLKKMPESHNDIPISLGYSGTETQGHRLPMKFPRQAMRIAKILIWLEVLMLASATVAEDTWLVVVTLGSVSMGIAALCCTVLVVIRNQDRRLRPDERISTRISLSAMSLALLLIFLSLSTAKATYQSARERGLSLVTLANLRAIGLALAAYENDHGVMPLSLGELVKDNNVTPKALISLLDPNNYTVLAIGGSSFVFRAAPYRTNDPNIIVAFEPRPWSRRDLRLFQEGVHAVLFADGHAVFLNTSELAAALIKDNEKRNRIMP